MRKISFLGLFITVMAISMMSCTGPRGPVGPAGQDANVYSMNVNVTSDDWTFTDDSWLLSLASTSITRQVVDNGVVLVYIEDPSDAYYAWRQIPLTYYYSVTSESDGSVSYYSSTIEMAYYEGGLDIRWTESDLYDGYNPGSQEFRVVIIEGASYAKSNEVDYSDYEAVKKYYGLKD